MMGWRHLNNWYKPLAVNSGSLQERVADQAALRPFLRFAFRVISRQTL